jgi:hypothetical protein
MLAKSIAVFLAKGIPQFNHTQQTTKLILFDDDG